jgi:hypothetical protein
MVTLYEAPGEDISFGRGLGQRAHVSEPKSAHAESARHDGRMVE